MGVARHASNAGSRRLVLLNSINFQSLMNQQRRCIHDENGNVDPIKAAEAPVPRGSVSSKKRPSDEAAQGTPVPVKKIKPSPPTNGVPPAPSFPQDHSASNSAVQHPPNGYHPSPAPQPHSQSQSTSPHQSNGETYHQPQHFHQEQARHVSHEQHQPPLDPSLFGYPEPSNNAYGNQSYPYPSANQVAQYQLPSLEQIANEVSSTDLTSV